MLIYAVILIGCCLLLIGVRNVRLDQQKQISYFCVFVLTAFSALRGYVGTDTYSYHVMFFDYGAENIFDIARIIEPLFGLLLKLVSLLTNNPFVFMGVISIIQGLILMRLVATSRSPIYFLLIYIAIFYLNFQFNILRAGTAVLLLVLAGRVPENENNQINFYMLGITSVLMHYSAAIGFIPMILMRQTDRNTKLVSTALILISVIISYYFVIGNEALYGKYLIYSGEYGFDVSQSTNRSFIIGLPLYLMLYLSVVRKENWIQISSFFLLWVGLRWLTTVLGFVGRVESIVNALLLFYIIERILIGWRNQMRNFALLGLTVMWLFGILLNIEAPAIPSDLNSNESYLNSPYTPYKFFWEN